MEFNKAIMIMAILLVFSGLVKGMCSMPNSIDNELNKSVSVFIGKLISFDNSSKDSDGFAEYIYTFNVSKVYKGEVNNGVRLRYSCDALPCGQNFDLNKEYLIYTFNYQGNLYSGGCGRTKELKYASGDLKFLEKLSVIDLERCKNLYYFDETSKFCNLREFCGTYVYRGLQTFETIGECNKALGDSNTSEYYVSCGCGCCGGFEERIECLPDNVTIAEMKKKDSDLKSGQICFSMGCSEPIRYVKCEGDNNKSKRYFNLPNGRKVEVKIMSETASLKAIERLGELGFNITLKETGGRGIRTTSVYVVEGEKEGKLFGFIKKKAKVSVEVDTETGEIVKENRPWWSFLASGV